MVLWCYGVYQPIQAAFITQVGIFVCLLRHIIAKKMLLPNWVKQNNKRGLSMRFVNQQNEIFWKNVIKHNLTRYEFKVLIAFVTDAPTYNTTITDLYKRTSIQKPHITRALKGLRYQEILVQNDNKVYSLSEHILQSEYEPVAKSTSDMRKNKEQEYKTGNGNFRQQSDNKKANIAVAEKNIKEMIKKTKQSNSKFDKWISYFSEDRGKNVWCLIEKKPAGGLIRFCEGNHLQTGRTVIAPILIAEEVCRKVLNISDPKEILGYIYSANLDEFMRKYNIRYDPTE